MTFPRFNIRLLIAIGIGALGLLVTVALALFIVQRARGPRGGVGELPGGVGQLPGIGEGPGGQVRTGEEGGLPGIGGGEQGTGTGDQGSIINDQLPVISEVADGGNTRVEPVVPGFPVAATVSPNGSVNFYDSDDGKFYQIGPDGEKRLLSGEAFPGVDEVAWSPQADSAILTFQDGSHVYYDFNTKKLAVLPKDLADPAFRSDGNSIVYKLETEDERNNWIIVSLPDGTGARAVQPTGENGDRVYTGFSPDNRVVATFRQPRGVDREEIFFVGQEGENFRSLEVQGSLFRGIWSPDGRAILYHTVLAGDEYRPNMSIAYAQGDAKIQYSLGMRTWVDRCTFTRDGRTVYCAVPETIPAGAGLVAQTVRNTAYRIFMIDATTRQTRLVAVPVEVNFGELRDVIGLQVSPDATELFLKTNEAVYKMRLK